MATEKRPEGNEAPEMTTDITFPPIGEEEQPTTPDTDPVAAQMAKLEERFEESQRAFAEERARWQQTVDRLIQTQAAPRQEPETPSAPEPVSFSDLPDPVDKPEDFKKALAQRFEQEMSRRMSSTLDQYQQQTKRQQTVSEQLDSVWSQFKDKYGDLADKSITLRGAVMAERDAMQQRGIDPQQGILADPDGFNERVATRMRQELGMQAPTPQEQTPPPASTPGQGQQTANRTGGVGGGSNLNAGGGKQNGKPPAFSDQLKKFQLDSGLI